MQNIISDIISHARRMNLVTGMKGGEKRGYISPDGQFIELAGWKNHHPLAKILGFEGKEEMVAAGFVRVAHTDFDMEYEFVMSDEAVANINASISWNIGLEAWPRKALIMIDIVGQKHYKFTAEDFVNADCDLRAALANLEAVHEV